MKKIILPAAMLLSILIYNCSKENAKPCSAPPVVSAGDDVELVNETTVTLSGTTNAKEGTWTIVQGSGGEIHTGGSTTTFTGSLKTTYTLKFESTNECGTTSDLLKIALNPVCGETRTIDKVVENMHWIQQSCFRIETGPITIYTDPSSITKKDTADIIVITHPHGDHYSSSDLDKLIGPNTILIAPEEVSYSGVAQRIVLTPGDHTEVYGCVTIKAVPAYNVVKTTYHPKSNNWVGYLITVNGVTIYHAGDTELIPEMKQFTCDIAMLSLGQTYTFDKVEDAAQAAKDVQAKLAIPMHFGLYEGTADDATTFKNLLDGTIPVVIKNKGE
jgi:L-ascorbate metabolism protein UlaG (beta-lactamase superfamily)